MENLKKTERRKHEMNSRVSYRCLNLLPSGHMSDLSFEVEKKMLEEMCCPVPAGRKLTCCLEVA